MLKSFWLFLMSGKKKLFCELLVKIFGVGLKLSCRGGWCLGLDVMMRFL